MTLSEITLVPADYKEKDPRQLAFNYASTIQNTSNGLVIYNKYVQQFIYYHSLEVAEQFAKQMGFILIPSTCIHWRRAKDFTDRRVKVGRKSFYALRENELNKKEQKKLIEQIEILRKAAIL